MTEQILKGNLFKKGIQLKTHTQIIVKRETNNLMNIC